LYDIAEQHNVSVNLVEDVINDLRNKGTISGRFIGKMFFFHLSEQESIDILDRLEQLEKRVSQIEESIKNNQVLSVCPKCKSKIPSNANACPHCGGSISEEAKFCPCCGSKLINGTS